MSDIREGLLSIIAPLYANHRKFRYLDTAEELVDTLLLESNNTRVADRLRLLIKDKPNGMRWRYFLLAKIGMKHCNSCNEDLPISSSSFECRSGTQAQCKTCRNAYTSEWAKENKERANSHTRAYQASKLHALPAWADKAELTKIYEKCPAGHQVDHIVPLRGKLVCGLHVPENLQYLTVFENQSKGNKYE